MRLMNGLICASEVCDTVTVLGKSYESNRYGPPKIGEKTSFDRT
jgi:hypothetical protein